MPKRGKRLDLLAGTLDMLILRTLLLGPGHGHEIAKHIQRTTDDILQVEHGSLYPALHRLEKRGLLIGQWQSRPGQVRQLKYYRLSAAGRRELAIESSRWRGLVNAITRIMRSAKFESSD